MSEEKRIQTVGVVVARFQVDDLHDGHRYLLDHICAQHETVLVVLGTSRGVPTARNPLPYSVRKEMVQAAYPNVAVMELRDHPLSTAKWSDELDALIRTRFPERPAILYGGRDSFIPQYSGTFPTEEIKYFAVMSGTEIRQQLIFPHTREARAAIIYATEHRFPIIYPTVDAAITRWSTEEVLLIGKDVHGGLLSFPGGFNDNKNESDEQAVIRERQEEVPGIFTKQPVYLGSSPIDDPRYRNTPDGITTRFFEMEYVSGVPSAGDDANHVEWVKIADLRNRLVPWHLPLADILLNR